MAPDTEGDGAHYCALSQAHHVLSVSAACTPLASTEGVELFPVPSKEAGTRFLLILMGLILGLLPTLSMGAGTGCFLILRGTKIPDSVQEWKANGYLIMGNYAGLGTIKLTLYRS